MIADAVTVVLVSLGLICFTVGTIGLIRLPDTPTRLHALTKADNLGLGLIAIGMAVYAGSAGVAAQLILIWVLALGAAATVATLLASRGPR